jgi:gamma-aminobutyric acid type B receptor
LTTVLSGGAENGGRSGNETEDSDGSGRNPGLRVDGSPSSEPFPLQFSFVTTYGGGVGYADLSIPAMSLAVEHVNANSSVLPNFRLSYNLNKPFKCSTETAQDVFFHEVFSQDSIVAFLGSACSQATRPIAELVHRWNISQILSSPLAIEADAVSTLPNLLRLYPQGTALVPALLSLVTHSGWRRMLVITEMNDMFTTIFDVLDEKFQQQNITVSSREFSSMIENPVQDVPDLLGEMDDYRVIFLNMNPSPARKILCTAHKKGYVYPFYTWILYGWYGSDWWRKASDNDTDMCSDSAVMSVLERAISIRLYPALFDEDAVSDTGISYKEFQEQYSRRLMHSSHSDSSNTFLFSASLTYDAVWTLAMALHNVDIMSTQSVRPEACVNVQNASGNLRDFDYSNSYLGCLIKQQLQHTNFVGVSGRVNFNEERSRHISTITILQYRPHITSSGISQVVFATYNTSGNALNYVLGESNLTVFPDGIPPDGTPRNVILPFNIGLTVTYYIIATFGIAFTVVCLIYNIKYRKTRVVKLTSPTLNYFLIIGAFLMFFSIYIRLLPDTSKTAYQYRCNLQNWMNVIAYCLAYGTILAKMGRVYKIFHNPTPKKQTGVKDWHMVMVVALITGVGVLLLTVEASFPQLRPNLALLPSEEHGSGRCK